MKYYGIVGELRQAPGVYGRSVPARGAEPPTKASPLGGDIALPALGRGAWLGIRLVAYVMRRWKSRELLLLNGIEQPLILVSDEYLASDYSLRDDDRRLLHGIVQSDAVFKTLMQSEGGSDLFILDRQAAAAHGLKHFGGQSGVFSPGLYCEHPKDPKTLLPLATAADLLQSEILEEVVRTFEALGATHILIEDLLDVSAELGGAEPRGGAQASAGLQRHKLREMRYEPRRAVDERRALDGKRHIFDLPNIMSVVEARTQGNQIFQKFEETISINCGLDVSVLNVVAGKAKFNYRRRWSFEVTFVSREDAKVSSGTTQAYGPRPPGR